MKELNRINYAMYRRDTVLHKAIDSDGEISDLQASELDECSEIIRNEVDHIAREYKDNERYIKELKKRHDDVIKYLNKKQSKFKELIFKAVKLFGGKIETPITSISARSTKSETVVITDTLEAMKAYPEAVVIKVLEFQVIHSLSKEMLKDIYKKNKAENKPVIGFYLTQSKVDFPAVTIKGGKNVTYKEE